ncbi:hypothetical protein [Frigidibacter sp. SD6-1]|uniref:hypothetical protein n=1 Tax=Frigidibacter sp. SD6-1 TaxID=3032581 RepID=UPI0024E01F06|nr:hypothetical protein [Frigidibacter sp. SD6-1]
MKDHGVFVGLIDLYDQSRVLAGSATYAGELCLCAIRAAELTEALDRLFEEVQNEAVDLRSITLLAPVGKYKHNLKMFNVKSLASFTRPLSEETSIVFSDAAIYEHDDD